MALDVPRPLNILLYDLEQQKWNFYEENLKAIYLHPEVKGKKVVIFSVVGDEKLGKSYTLNRFIQCLEGDEYNPNLAGFLSMDGDEATTQGIQFWSKPYMRTLPNGEEVAILLMDTEGIFNDSKGKDVWGRIFGISIRFSSVLMFNVDRKIGNNTLEDLRLFVSLGDQLGDKLIVPGMKDSLQKLVFLVRNCTHRQGRTVYGKEVGQAYLNKKLDISSKGTESARNVKAFVSEIFGPIECYFLPHPFDFPENRSRESQYNLFEGQLTLMVEDLLKVENLVVKEVTLDKVTGENIFPLFRRACQSVSQISSVMANNAIICFLLNPSYMKVYRAKYLALIEQVCRNHNGNVCELIRKETMTKNALLQEFNRSLNYMTTEEQIFLRNIFAEELEKVSLPVHLLPLAVFDTTAVEKWSMKIFEKLGMNGPVLGGLAWTMSDDLVAHVSQFGKTTVNVGKASGAAAVPMLIYLAIQMHEMSQTFLSKENKLKFEDLTKAKDASVAMEDKEEEKVILGYFNRKVGEVYQICTIKESYILPKDFVIIFEGVTAEILLYFTEYWSHCTNLDDADLFSKIKKSLAQKISSLCTANNNKLKEKRVNIAKSTGVVTLTGATCIALGILNPAAGIGATAIASISSLYISYKKYKNKKEDKNEIEKENESSSNEAISILLRQHPELTKEDLIGIPTNIDDYMAFLEKHIPQLVVKEDAWKTKN